MAPVEAISDLLKLLANMEPPSIHAENSSKDMLPLESESMLLKIFGKAFFPNLIPHESKIALTSARSSCPSPLV